jgi:hypothetical protein
LPHLWAIRHSVDRDVGVKRAANRLQEARPQAHTPNDAVQSCFARSRSHGARALVTLICIAQRPTNHRPSARHASDIVAAPRLRAGRRATPAQTKSIATSRPTPDVQRVTTKPEVSPQQQEPNAPPLDTGGAGTTVLLGGAAPTLSVGGFERRPGVLLHRAGRKRLLRPIYIQSVGSRWERLCREKRS